MSFDAKLPNLISEDWREAIAIANRPGKGAASYQAPGGEAVSFVLKDDALAGGTSVSTDEYPFFGGWSNNSLNEKPQTIKVKGQIGGVGCFPRRNALVEALRVPTSDDTPGYIMLPSWGRFAVVVSDWEVSESVDKLGMFLVSLNVTRAGQSESVRQASAAKTASGMEKALAALSDAAVDCFVAELPEGKLSTQTMAAVFGQLASKLLAIVGRVRAAQSKLNAVTNSVLAITNLIDQGVMAPKTLAITLMSSMATIVAIVEGTGNDIEALFSAESDSEDVGANAWVLAMAFLANANAQLPAQLAANKDYATQHSVVNLYKVASFYATGALLPAIGEISYSRFQNLLALFLTLEESIDREDHVLATACVDMRIAIARALDARQLYRERVAHIASPMPVLALAAKLGIDYGTFKKLNPSISDEFLVAGEVTYV